MQINTRYLLHNAGLSALLSSLLLAGCGGSGDSETPPETPVTPPVTPVLVQANTYGSTVVEGADNLEFVVSLSTASTETINVTYSTFDGTAIEGTDYSATNGTLNFAPGETRKFIPVTVLNNTTAPAPAVTSKNMQLLLDGAENADINQSTATGTIIDREAMSADTTFTANWPDKGAFTNATQCADGCHEASDPIMFYDGKDISPNTQWQYTVMAHSFNDPYWQAAVEDEALSFPHLSGFIEDTCTKCHAPMGRTHAYHDDPGLTEYPMDTARTEDHAREGVSCTACHQIEAGNLGTAASFSGGFTIEGNPLESDYKDIYGQYASPFQTNMVNQTGHRPVEGTHIKQSELCATCHTLYTPTLDPDTGAQTGTSFLEQGPYLEWQNSVYTTGQAQEAQCQDCHMPEPVAAYSTKISLLPANNNVSNQTQYGQHTLLGGNAHLLEILRDYSNELGINEGQKTIDGFNEQITLTKNFLDSAADVAISTLTPVGNNLEFNVEVSNNAGHKVPSAYPSRRAWLHVVVKNGSDQVFFESGKPDSRGYISTDAARLKADCMSGHKLDGFDSSLCFEPHRDVISDESQIVIYETVLADTHDDITHTLLQASKYLKDNRIPPTGFTNSVATTIEPQTVPMGVAGDSNFNCVGTVEGCGMDTVSYQINTEGQTGPYTVDVRLLYQATQPGFVDGMHNAGARIDRFKVMYDAVPPTVEVLATATKS